MSTKRAGSSWLGLVLLLAALAISGCGAAVAAWAESEPTQSEPLTGRVEGVVRTTGGWSLEGRQVALEQEAEVAVARLDQANRFVFESVPPGDGYVVRLLGIDDGPLGPCSDPEPFAVHAGQTTPVLVVCWR